MLDGAVELEGCEAAFGKDHLNTHACVMNLVRLLKAMGKDDDAKEMLPRSSRAKVITAKRAGLQ